MFFEEKKYLIANVRVVTLCLITLFNIGCYVEDFNPVQPGCATGELWPDTDLSGIWTISGNGTRTNCGDVIDEEETDSVDLRLGPMELPIKFDGGRFTLQEDEWKGDSAIQVEGVNDDACAELESLTITEFGDEYGELVLHDAVINDNQTNPVITGRFRLHRNPSSDDTVDLPWGCKQLGQFTATIRPFQTSDRND